MLTAFAAIGDHRAMRIILLLAAVLALVPAAGATLCVAESGHMAIEISGGDCAPPSGGGCLEACRDCEDTPLSVGAAHRAPAHESGDAPLLPSVTPAGFFASSYAIEVSAPRAIRPAATSRTPLLRC
jgi:hypothetical protein